jgi:hypothetical protein
LELLLRFAPEFAVMRFKPFRALLALALLAAVGFLSSAAPAPEIVVQPYVQPSDSRDLPARDVKIIRWFTDQTPGDFTVEFQVHGGAVRSASVERIALDFPALPMKAKEKLEKKPADGVKEVNQNQDPKEPKQAKDEKKKGNRPGPPKEVDQHYFRYTSYLEGLPLNSSVQYTVKLGDKVIRQAAFRTRATPDKMVRCALVGDMAEGRPEQNPIAYQIGEQRPEFVMALGDIVYETGRMNEYMQNYWGTYNNVAQASPQTGAPLMASMPFYGVLGNHDISAKLPAVPDAFAAYYIFSAPKNGPGEGPWATQLGKDDVVAKKFRLATKDSYPNLDAYSFNYGAAHFVVLDDNKGMQLEAPALLKWLKDDLTTTPAKWKFVCFHIPSFHSSKQHYPEQQMRPLEPLLEECGVDMTFAGHVHNYQRTVPLKFNPEPPAEKKTAKVDGQFTLDKEFDGVKNTKPSGIIHIVAGGGGAELYGPGLDKTLDYLQQEFAGNYGSYTAKLVADEHSFVVMDYSADKVVLRALGSTGNEIDKITITK